MCPNSAYPAPTSRDLISLADAAAYASCHTRTIRRRIAEGALTGYGLGSRIIRVDRAEVEALFTRVGPTLREAR